MKQHFTKRLLALLLTLAMVLSLVPMTFAEETAADEYVLATELKDGDQVVIYNPGSKTAVSSTVKSNYYLTPVNTTVEDDAITDPDASVVWTVAVNEDGSYTFTQGEFTLAAYASGTHVNLSNTADGHDPNWIVTAINSTEKTFNLKSATVEKDSKPVYLEYYSRYTEFSAYATDDATGDAFAMQFYVLNTAEEPIDPPAGDLSGKTIILHTNDTHGALLGFAQVAKVKADYEARGATVILVDAGDYSQGTTYVSTNKGEAAVTMLNAAGYDFVTLGNHEFDFGYAQLIANMEKAEFKPIVADVLLKETGKSIFDGHVIKEVNGVKIGFFGMETPETFTKVNPGLIQEITFPMGEEMYACAQAEVDALKEEGADLIIGLVHLGVDDESEPNRSIDLYENVTDIDFLIDGHSHTVMTEGPNGEPIQSTGTKASKTALMNVGLIQIDNATKAIEKNELIPLGADAPVDETVAAVAQEIMDAVDAEYNVKFAESQVELNGDKAPGNRNMETNLGDLITDALKWSVLKDLDAETLGVPAENVVAITNGGGIRAWIHVGDVTKNDVNTVLPFGNTVAVVYVTGAELLEALEASTFCTPTAVGGFPQVSGMKFNVDVSKPFDEGDQYPDSTYYGPASIRRVTINEINGQEFDPEATYAVVTNNFCAAGGDTYYAFHAASSQFDTGIPMDEALMEYITEELDGVIGEEYAEPQGRITQEHIPGALDGKTVILHTNDTHGALLGFAQVAKVKADYEARGATVILVDAGDYSQGTTYVSTNKGEAAVTMLNAAGYDFVTLGNHEFDFGYAQLIANMEKAEFKPIVADVLLKETGKSIFDGHVIKEVNGVKIGFFGMETPETFTKVNPGLIQEITFPMGEEMYACAQAEVDALKEEGADLIIGLVHLGVDDESEPNRSIDLYENVTDIDFLIDGHSHTVMTEGPNGEPIQSTGTKDGATAFMNVGLIQIDNATKTIEKNELIPLGKEAPVDETVAAVAQEIMDAVNAEYGAKFAESEVDLNGDRAPGNRNMETNLGDLITDALKWSVLKDMDAETLGVPQENVVAITNGGGIRAWIKKGDITKNDVNTVLPFGNTVAVVYVTGAELLEALEASTYCTPTAVGGFPQVSGIKFTIDTKKSFDEGELYPGSTYHGPASIRRVTINEINGQEFDLEATYAVVTNNFCAAGGDTYYAFQAASSQFDTGIPMDEALMAYIVEELNGVVGQDYAEPQGRITIKNGFADVQDPSKYYYTPVYWAYDFEPQITGGKTDTLFGVKDPCTREQIVTFLWKAYGAKEPTNTDNPFTDVKEGKYYFKAVMWAKENGITSGKSDTKFGVKEACTREQVVTFLWKAAGKPEPTITESPFTDVKEGKYYTKAVLWALENGVTGGVSADKFGVGKTCTREQIVSFLYKAIEGIEHTCFPSTSNEDIAKYGNIYTDMDGAALFEQGYNWGDIVTVKFLDKSLDLPLVPTFSYVDSGTPGVFVNKDENGKPTGRVFMAINMGNFAEAYGLATKTTNADKTYFWTANEGVEFPVPVTIRMNKAGGYLTEMTIRDINRTNNREDYPELSDEEFANFRRITTTGMGDHLYRGSSPINPEIGRNTYADAALKKAGVTVVMNLANSQADAEAYPGFAESYYSKQNVVYLNLGVDFFAEEFKTGLAAGLRHFAENQGVYYVHCTEGKDRAGFVSALLECFMGATYEEVVADYLKTYTNYYTVVDGVQQPLSEETLNAIAESNIIKTLQRAFDVEDLTTADLAAEAEAYIKELGLNDEEITALKANLAGEAELTEAEFEFLITSDIHGQFFATDYTRPYEQSGTHNQGMTRISTYLKEQKAEYGDNAYLVDMGDTFQGAPLTYYYAFNKPDVEDPAIKTFRHIGYDMWIVGNHEFNYGLDILTRQMDYAVSPSTENEKQLTISMANYLKAETNNDETKDWATWRDVAPYVIKDFDGVKVAIIGFGNPNIPQWDVPANWEGIYFANILDTYKHYEPEMLEQADMIVAVAHSGIGSDPDSDFMERLINATDSIAFAFSGHEHGSQVYNATNAKGETVPILQPGTKARYVAKVLVNYDKAEGSYEIAPELVDLRNYPLDEELVEILQPYETDTWENYMLQPIGKALGDFPAANLGTAPSAFVDLINTVQLWGAYDRGGVNTPDDPSDDTPAMLSITAPLTSGNNANLISQGDIYLGDMFGLYRFENWFYQITMSGEEVHQWLEYSASKLVSDGNGGYNIQGGLTYYDIIYGEGFHYDFDASKPAGERVVNMKYNGQPVTPDQEFTVVVNNYRYNGGGDYVKYLNEHGCSFTPNDPDRIIYSTQFDMIQGEDEGQARTLLTRYIQQETEAHGGITPTILSDWRILDGSEEPTEPSFVKVTGSTDLTDGVYLIVYEADGYAMDGSLENMDVVKDYAAVSIQDGAIPCTEELLASAFTIDMSAGTIANASGVYIGRSSDANGLEQSASPLTNSISIDAEGNAVIQSGGAYLRFNSASDQLRFRYFKSSTYTRQKDIALYKLVEG